MYSHEVFTALAQMKTEGSEQAPRRRWANGERREKGSENIYSQESANEWKPNKLFMNWIFLLPPYFIRSLKKTLITKWTVRIRMRKDGAEKRELYSRLLIRSRLAHRGKWKAALLRGGKEKKERNANDFDLNQNCWNYVERESVFVPEVRWFAACNHTLALTLGRAKSPERRKEKRRQRITHIARLVYVKLNFIAPRSISAIEMVLF